MEAIQRPCAGGFRDRRACRRSGLVGAIRSLALAFAFTLIAFGSATGDPVALSAATSVAQSADPSVVPLADPSADPPHTPLAALSADSVLAAVAAEGTLRAPSTLSPLGRSLRSAWARGLGGAVPSRAGLTLTYPAGPPGAGAGSGLTYYPSEGVRTVDGLGLSQQQAFFYGVRKFELGRHETALKGAGLAGNVGLFAGAMAASFGWLSESEGLWLAGGAAVLGAAYGAAVGYESTAFREEWRWPKLMEDEPGIHVRAHAR